MISLETWFGAGIGFFLSLISSYIIYRVSRRNNDPRIRIREFSRTESNEQEFYKQLLKSTNECRKEIVQYAEGFNTSLPERQEIACQYIQDIKEILQRNPHISWIRYQTLLPGDSDWIRLISQVQEKFPHQLKLLYVDNKLGDHIVSIVLIDPGTKYSKTFLLVANPVQLGGDQKINLANSGLMITGSKAFSNALRYQIELMYDRLK